MNNKKKNIFLLILKKIKVRHFLILALLLIGNSFAWFIYVDTVRNSVDVHVKAWKIDFTDGDTPVSEIVNITVSDVAPGMTPYSHSVTAYNYSEVSANVEYTILSARIMDEEFITVEGKGDAGLQLTGDELTSAQLITRLSTYYPFTITFAISSSTMQAQNGQANFTVNLSWPFESGNDTWDTYWGVKAYDYKVDNPTSPSISMNIKLTISQSSV